MILNAVSIRYLMQTPCIYGMLCQFVFKIRRLHTWTFAFEVRM